MARPAERWANVLGSITKVDGKTVFQLYWKPEPRGDVFSISMTVPPGAMRSVTYKRTLDQMVRYLEREYEYKKMTPNQRTSMLRR